ncbi:MAG: hypothetical protein AB2815_05450, partial [Candidatus Sedimenticola endophacoides]
MSRLATSNIPIRRAQSTPSPPAHGTERQRQFTNQARVSLPRERFWDIPVPKIDSPTRQPLLPRP